MNTAILSHGDVITAKQDFFLYDKEFMYSRCDVVNKGSVLFIVSVKQKEGYTSLTLCVLSSELKKLGWIHIASRDYFNENFSVLAPTP